MAAKSSTIYFWLQQQTRGNGSKVLPTVLQKNATITTTINTTTATTTIITGGHSL